MRIIDLSHTIEDGMITYKGLPAPVICDFLSRPESRKFYALGTEFHIAKIEMVSNTGTYIDCPFHRFAEGKDFTEIALEQLVDIPASIIHLPGKKVIDQGDLEHRDLSDRAVLIHTGWDRHWRTDQYFEDHPYLTEAAARYLQETGVRLVGIDSLNIDDTTNKTRPVHTILLGSEILIIEHLCNLSKIPEQDFLLTAAPPRISGVGSFPVRVYAKF